MLALKVSDLRLRGCGFTLFPAAKENNVPEDLMHYLFSAMYFKAVPELTVDDSKNLPDVLTADDFDLICCSEEFSDPIQSLFDYDLITNNSDGINYILTPKSLRILNRASQIMKELDDSGFYYCPCHMF